MWWNTLAPVRRFGLSPSPCGASKPKLAFPNFGYICGMLTLLDCFSVTSILLWYRRWCDQRNPCWCECSSLDWCFGGEFITTVLVPLITIVTDVLGRPINNCKSPQELHSLQWGHWEMFLFNITEDGSAVFYDSPCHDSGPTIDTVTNVEVGLSFLCYDGSSHFSLVHRLLVCTTPFLLAFNISLSYLVWSFIPIAICFQCDSEHSSMAHT